MLNFQWQHANISRDAINKATGPQKKDFLSGLQTDRESDVTIAQVKGEVVRRLVREKNKAKGQ